MLRPFAHPVACCCILLGVLAQSFKPVNLLAKRKWTEICPEMHALAKMAISRQNRQTINKNSNEMAKRPFGKW